MSSSLPRTSEPLPELLSAAARDALPVAVPGIETALGASSPWGGGCIISVKTTGVVLPSQCACCRAPASYSRVERHPRNRSLIVPYCGDCAAHTARAFTRRLAGALAGGVMGGTLALALPLTFFELSLTLHLGLVGMTSGAFWLMAQLWPHRLTDHHASDSRAVWFLAEERLCCRNAQWAADLLATEPSATVVASPDHDPDGELASALRRERVRGLLGAALGIAALLGIAVASHNFFYPLVRVVNLTDEQLEVRVDGRWIATVPPSTVESPTAGAELFPPAGRHRWTATNRRGQVISDVNGVVTAGAEHLYAPGEHDKCFWVETVHYGRGADPDNAIERLPPGLGFWRLPSGVDAWFVPNPPNRSSSLATTGGKLTAMRQARCSVAP